jgi:YesN/AraC family two-component response regulator
MTQNHSRNRPCNSVPPLSPIHRKKPIRKRNQKKSRGHQKRTNEPAFSYYSCLKRVKEYVESHRSESVPLQTAAKIASLETKYFSAFFHRKVGITYKDWLTTLQITNAKRLIMAVDSRLTDVASEAGFKDLRTFERAFKKYTSQTPMNFKKLVRPS